MKYIKEPQSDFRRLLIEHFGKADEIREATDMLGIARQTYWMWDRAGGPPERLIAEIEEYFRIFGIELPEGKTVKDYTRPYKHKSRRPDYMPKQERIGKKLDMSRKNHFRISLQEVLKDHSLDEIHNHVVSVSPFLGISHLFRWAYETPCLPASRFPFAFAALQNLGYIGKVAPDLEQKEAEARFKKIWTTPPED